MEYADSHPGVRSGFVDKEEWEPLEVVFPEELRKGLTAGEVSAVTELLAQDPRPRYQDDPERIYGMTFEGRDIRFKVDGGTATVTAIQQAAG